MSFSSSPSSFPNPTSHLPSTIMKRSRQLKTWADSFLDFLSLVHLQVTRELISGALEVKLRTTSSRGSFPSPLLPSLVHLSNGSKFWLSSETAVLTSSDILSPATTLPITTSTLKATTKLPQPIELLLPSLALKPFSNNPSTLNETIQLLLTTPATHRLLDALQEYTSEIPPSNPLLRFDRPSPLQRDVLPTIDLARASLHHSPRPTPSPQLVPILLELVLEGFTSVPPPPPRPPSPLYPATRPRAMSMGRPGIRREA